MSVDILWRGHCVLYRATPSHKSLHASIKIPNIKNKKNVHSGKGLIASSTHHPVATAATATVLNYKKMPSNKVRTYPSVFTKYFDHRTASLVTDTDSVALYLERWRVFRPWCLDL